MANDLRNTILELLAESSRFNINDVLVDIRHDHRKLYFVDTLSPISVEEFPKNIIRDAKETQKESGVNSLCLAMGSVTLSLQERTVRTPILLAPLSYKLDKVAKEYSFLMEEDTMFVNPFLAIHLEQELEITIPESVIADISLDSIIEFLAGKGLEGDNSINTIGNFHHHRYQIIKELEELSKIDSHQPSLKSLFGLGSISTETISFPRTNLFPADTDHENIFHLVKSDNCVIQGPPGTGKSQVLTNLIGKLVGASKRTVIISEKHAALDVIEKKLSNFELDKLSFIASADRMSHSFLRELKSTWNYFEQFTPVNIENIRLSEQYEDQLQMTLDMLSQSELIGGISFDEFSDRTVDEKIDGNFFSGAPSILQFLAHESTLKKAYTLSMTNALGRLRNRTLLDSQFSEMDVKIGGWIASIESLKVDFSISTWIDLSSAMKKAALCQVYENDLYKKYQAIFKPKSKAQKSFIRLRKSYNQVVNTIDLNGSEWKISPSLEEAKSLQKILEDGSFWLKRKARKRWSSISHLPVKEASTALERKIKSEETNQLFSQILTKFYDLGLENPKTEVQLIHQTLGAFSEDQWEEFENIPKEIRLSMTRHHRTLQKLHSDLLHHFRFEDSSELLKYLTDFKITLPALISEKSNLSKLDDNALKTMLISSSFEDYRSVVFSTNYTKFKEQFPHFSNFKPEQISDKIVDVILAKSSEAKQEARSILQRVHSEFSRYHELLNTPARKLSDQDKELKKELRKGKSILVKEFSKTRSHPSLRELFNSEARIWIQLLKPIWLSNPTQLAKCFPLESNIFDVAIFDEASQIPVQNALGGIHRAARIIVAGDEHQMGPSSYFTKTSSEPMDLLHQASYHFKKGSLKHHYRSSHPDLISFSNAHFYAGELKAFPAAGSLGQTALRHHYMEDAVFVDRKNISEAQRLANCIKEFLNSDKTIGIVAFSEEQLSCIWTELGSRLQHKLTEHLDKYGGFFKALENVQGDECDHLIISFGYAPNEEGDFHMRFGPMNTVNGRKRLNVLLTRAIESIDFFCSIKSSAFRLSDNESINLLRQWISFSEQYEPSSTPDFPSELTPKIEGNRLTFSRIQETMPNAREVVTLHRALENRGWKVCYD